MDCLWPKYVMFELKKYRGIMFDSTEYWGKIWRKTDSNFILGSKMAKLNQNKYRPDWSDAVWTLCFNLEINE